MRQPGFLFFEVDPLICIPSEKLFVYVVCDGSLFYAPERRQKLGGFSVSRDAPYRALGRQQFYLVAYYRDVRVLLHRNIFAAPPHLGEHRTVQYVKQMYLNYVRPQSGDVFRALYHISFVLSG